MPVIETKGAASSGGFGQFARQVAANYIEDAFSTFFYSGTDAVQTITNGIDLAGKGGMVWVKSRNFGDAANVPCLFDTVRGPRSILMSNSTSQADVFGQDALTATSSGFTLSSDPSNYGFNNNGSNQVSWTFRKQAKFFDVVTYTGDGVAGRTISHSLGSVPGCIIVKRTNTAANWVVWHRSLSDPSKYLVLNSAAGTATDTGGPWGPFNGGYTTNASAFTDTFFRVANDIRSNAIGGTYVAYLFAHDAGGFGASGTDNVITCGSFTTDGSGLATVNLGYEPQWVLLKDTAGNGGWFLLDTMRGLSITNNSDAILYANTSAVEILRNVLSPTATGFVADAASELYYNTTYVYIAIRRGPMKTPTSGTSVFGANLRSATTVNGTDVTAPSPLPTAGDWFWLYNRGTLNDLNSYPATWARLIGGNALSPQNTNTETGSVLNYGYGQTAIRFTSTWDGAAKSYVQYFFRRAPGFFDVVCYAGTGSARTVNHNLSVAPELMIVKRRNNVRNWAVYASSVGADKFLKLNLPFTPETDTSVWNNTAPTSTVFSVGTSADGNGSGDTYVAYLFASCPGVSKVGSYTGTGTTQQINCGFTGGARFVMIKRTDSTGDWYVWDSARGIVAGDDPYLLLNSTAAEVINTDYIDTLSTGFEISSTAPAAINANGGSYIFLAIA